MGEFFRFWSHCIRDGWELGEGAFGFIETGCTLIALSFYFLKKLKPAKWKEWEERIMRTAFWVFVGSFLLATLVIAPFRQYKEEADSKEKAQKTLDDRSPKLDGFINQNMLGDQIYKTNSLIVLQVTVGNSGGSPSIAEEYQLEVILTNKTSLDAELVDLSDEYKWNAQSPGSSVSYTLRRTELISEKTSKAIQPGDAPRGWIAFNVPGHLLSQYERTNITLVLSFLDINGNRIFVTNGFSKGKPTKYMELQGYPKTLPGSVNLVSQPDTNDQRTNETNTEGWQPPELPPGCSNVSVFFGGLGMIYPIVIAKISPEKAGTKFPITDLPEYLVTNMSQMPNYTPRTRNMWVRWDSIRQEYGGKTVNIPIFPFVVSNRFYVEIEIPFLNERRRIVMSDAFDSEISKLPRTWDRNYSTNAFVYEVVNEYTNPVLQVFYTKPNEVHVNGIFIVDTNAVLESFGEPPQLKTMLSYRVINMTNMQEITNVSDYLGTNSMADILTNVLYDLRQPGQKAIFKYPSNRNPGVFAD